LFFTGVDWERMAVNGLYHEPIVKEEMQGMTTVWGYPSQTIRNNTSALNLINCRNLLFYSSQKFTGIAVRNKDSTLHG
jgi:putative SOS response-associated peptidase YedK